jgi:hypothetical protein
MTVAGMNEFRRTDPEEARSARAPTALFHIAGRHAVSPEQRSRQVHPMVLSPHEAIRLVVLLAGGGAQAGPEEPETDESDLAAALTLIPHARAELDEVEVGLLRIARGRGMTWQDIAYGLGLGSAQAARQRYERLAGRTSDPVEEPGGTAP